MELETFIYVIESCKARNFNTKVEAAKVFVMALDAKGRSWSPDLENCYKSLSAREAFLLANRL